MKDAPAAKTQSSAVKARAPSYAGFWVRGLALQIDFVIAAVLAAGSLVVASLVLPANRGLGWAIAEQLLSLTIFILYFAGLEASAWRATVGKRLLRLRVTDLHGQPLRFSQSLMRNLAKMGSVLFFGLGLWSALRDRKKQTFHDRIAATFVLRKDGASLVGARLAKYESILFAFATLGLWFVVAYGMIQAVRPVVVMGFSKVTVDKSLSGIKPLQKHVEAALTTKGALPSDVTAEMLDGIEMPPGSRIGYFPSRGSIQVRFAFGEVAGGSLLVTPERDGDVVRWGCISANIPKKYRPLQCD